MRRFGADERGQMVVLVAAMMMALLMFVGLAIDAGQLFVARRTMQEAADAGAYAGAVVLYQKGTQTQAFDAARYDTTLNGYTDTVDGFTVIIRQPMSGQFSGNPLYVEVIIEGSVRTALVPAQSALTLVRVRGVAGAEPLNNNYAIMSLDRGSTDCAFRTESQANITLVGGGVLVNSSSNTAACNQVISEDFKISPAPPHGVDINGNSGSDWPPGMDVDIGQPQQADPFAGSPKPTTTGCDPALPNDPCTIYNSIPNDNVVYPGIWTTSLTANGNTTLYLNPGIYILKGYGVNATGNSDLISTNASTTPACATNCGVLLFNTHTNYPGAVPPGDACGGLNLSGNASTNLAAMTTGTYANFLVYQDPNCPDEMTIAGNGTFIGSGTIYLPNATFTLNGNNATLTGSQLVAKKVNLQNGDIAITFTAGTSAQPILPRLAE